MKRVAFLFFIISLVPLASLASPSPLCINQGLVSLKIDGVDQCQLPESEIEPNVLKIITRIGSIHRQVALTLGQSFSETYNPGISVDFSPGRDGSMDSYTLKNGSEVILRVFPDWTREQPWPEKTYAHELTHALLYRKDSVLRAGLAGLIDHPMMTEAFPDLIGLSSLKSNVMPFEDSDLAPCLQVNRDASFTRSLSEPFASFASFASSTRMAACCASLPESAWSEHTKTLCERAKDTNDNSGFYEKMKEIGATNRPPTAAELAHPFRPSRCYYKVHGINVFGRCDSHEFGVVLVSFFSELEKQTRMNWVTPWVETLKRQAKYATSVTCRFRKGTQTSPVTFSVRAITPSLQSLRSAMSPKIGSKTSQIFDQIWKTHGLDRLKEMDQLYMEEGLEYLSLPYLTKAEPNYVGANSCGSPISFKDSESCAVDCR